MKRLTLFLMCVMASFALTAQNTRVIKGLVFSEDDIPMKGVTLKVVGMDGSTVSAESGQFELYVSPYAKKVEASMEGYVSHILEIDGSYLVFKLKVDKEYAKRKAAEEEAARVAAEQAKAAEEARIAAEKEAAEKAAAEKTAEEERIRKAAEKEAAAKAKAEERARKAAEREAAAQAKAEENARKSAERETAAQAKTKDKAQSPTIVEKKTRPNKNIASTLFTKRKASFVSVGYYDLLGLLSDNDGVQLSYTYGTFNKKQNLFFGGGLSFSMAGYNTNPIYEYEVWDSELKEWLFFYNCYEDKYVHINAFANGKYFFSTNKWRPFVSLSCGLGYTKNECKLVEESRTENGVVVDSVTHYDYSFNGLHLYVNPEVGVLVDVKNNLSVYATLGLPLYWPEDGGVAVSVGVTF